ncbi:MAG: sigma-70 family RNA polymerase sigma factor [Rhodothermales bacterium]|nr:sigma-70 family RNA polymerase sigma factor [Rhodothermales bacterium]
MATNRKTKYYTDATGTPASLLERIPFSLDDTDRVNALYFDNYGDPEHVHDEAIDVWTYCYIRRYYQMKYARDFDGSIADYDKMIAECFRKVARGRKSLGASKKYANWVSVICKNTFLNYVRSKRKYISIDRTYTQLYSANDPVATGMDSRLLLGALRQAIERLPSFLQTIATRRIVEEQDYITIAEETGKSVPTIRSYVNKALKRIRNDKRFMRYFEEVE